MPHANSPSYYHSKILLLLLLLLLLFMSSDSSLYKTKIREGVLGLTTGSTKDLTRLIIRAFLGDMPMGEWEGLGRRRNSPSCLVTLMVSDFGRVLIDLT